MKALLLLWTLIGSLTLPVQAQPSQSPQIATYQPMSAPQLDQLLGPVALYPDPLIAQMLPAATFPDQITAADQYVSAGGDPNAIDQQPWDSSVQAMARYPTVLKWMDDNLGWTTSAGQAFLNQQQEVMDSIQRLRAEARNMGNLHSTPQEVVVGDPGDIEILPADPELIYVPVYQPETVYYRSGFLPVFGLGFAFGIWMHHDFDWRQHHLVVWSREHPRPPEWWHERHEKRVEWLGRQSVWHRDVHRGPVVVTHPNHPGDRGWDRPVARPPVVVPRAPAPEQPHETPGHPVVGSGGNPRGQVRAEPSPPVLVHRPPANGAFIGAQSSEATRNYSQRGQQSRQTITRPALTPHPAPPAIRPAPAPSHHDDPKRNR
ncbi:MAG TPA: DUF3300 domain-containing protein [Candidatus Limnocylindria bacterium]|jgi:hypothetical protein|nr:DUF3300 domain-containing protein [Candidatus Limnocylindria bacterium]